MRTFRLSLTATLIVVLLGGMAAITLAQSDADAPVSAGSAVVSGAVPYGRGTVEPTMSFEQDRVTYRDHALVILIDVADPRLTGDLWMTLNYDTFHDSHASVGTGVAGMDHGDGSWQGTVQAYGGLFQVGTRSYLQVDMTGAGSYEGLSVVLFLLDNGYELDAEGMIFAGAAPPVPEPAE